MAWMSGSCFLRDAMGPALANLTANVSLSNASLSVGGVVEYLVDSGNTTLTTAATNTCEPGQCDYGLLNDMQVGGLAPHDV